MKKVRIIKIDGYNHELTDNDNKRYIKNIKFNTIYKPQVNDIIYLSKDMLDEINIFSFIEKPDRDNIKESEIIKIISGDKQYYYIRQYG